MRPCSIGLTREITQKLSWDTIWRKISKIFGGNRDFPEIPFGNFGIPLVLPLSSCSEREVGKFFTFAHFSCIQVQCTRADIGAYVWVIDKARGKHGWICSFLRDEAEVPKHAKKKNEANIQPSSPSKFGQ